MSNFPETKINKATPLDQLPADSDDSNVVNNILADMEAQNNNQAVDQRDQMMQQQYQQQQFAVNPQQMLKQQQMMQQQEEPQEEYYEEYQEQMPEPTMKDKILFMMKDPTLVFVIFMMLSNDLVRAYIVKFVEKFVKNPNYIIPIELCVRGLLAALLFYFARNLF